MLRRDYLQGLASSLLMASWPFAEVSAQSTNWPAKPVRWIVPFPAGGTSDLLSRLMAAELAKSFGQPVVVDNKPGAGTVIGVDLAAKSPADGYTLVCIANSYCANQTLVKNLPYEPRDLRPVGLLAISDHVLVTNPTSGIKSLNDLLLIAKKNPGKISYASFGNGTSSHLAGAMLSSQANLDLIHVPYKGQAPAMNDLMGGQVHLMFGNWSEMRHQVRSGKLVPLGMATAKRSVQAADIPTLTEQGLPLESNSWFGVLTRAGVADEVVLKLNQEINKALQSANLLQALNEGSMQSLANTPERFADFIKSETEKYAKVIRQAHISLEG